MNNSTVFIQHQIATQQRRLRETPPPAARTRRVRLPRRTRAREQGQ